VWEGVNIVTNNFRLFDIRKTIIELILANHPQDCFFCVKNKKCELQSLAAEFGIRDIPFERSSSEQNTAVPHTSEETITHNADKCIKCGRCIEACQEVQTIRAINSSHRSHKFAVSTAYEQSLEDTPCVFCGKCASVCPVGAIYEHDQTAEVFSALNNKERYLIAQVSGALVSAMDSEFALAAGTITSGKITAALRLLGFHKVYDANIAVNASKSELSGELEQRLNSGGKIPLISGSSEGVSRFIKNFYPDLTDYLAAGRRGRRIFAEVIKSEYAAAEGIDVSTVTSISFVPCIAHKFGAGGKTDFALTAAELVRMIKLAGIDIAALPEESFDAVKIDLPKYDNAAQKEIILSFAQARKVMESIRKGECTAKWVEIEASVF
jgi:ferredoxin